jgi:hypothetical protein
MGGAECFPLGSDAVCIAVGTVALQGVVHTAAVTAAAGGSIMGAAARACSGSDQYTILLVPYVGAVHKHTGAIVIISPTNRI